MNVVYAASAYPIGKMSDKVSHAGILSIGIIFLIIADITLALAGSVWWVMLGAVFWGLHMGATQGLLSAIVADEAPQHLRGTAFGIFNLITGLSLLFASIIAGWLWSEFGASMTFYAGAIFSIFAFLGMRLRKLAKH